MILRYALTKWSCLFIFTLYVYFGYWEMLLWIFKVVILCTKREKGYVFVKFVRFRAVNSNGTHLTFKKNVFLQILVITKSFLRISNIFMMLTMWCIYYILSTQCYLCLSHIEQDIDFALSVCWLLNLICTQFELVWFSEKNCWGRLTNAISWVLANLGLALVNYCEINYFCGHEISRFPEEKKDDFAATLFCEFQNWFTLDII